MGVTAEGALEDAPVASTVEHGAPSLQLADAVGCLPGMELGHARVVEHPPAHHRVAEVGLPRVTASTWASAAAMPPSAMTVWALPSSDLQAMPTDAPASAAAMAAGGQPRRPR